MSAALAISACAVSPAWALAQDGVPRRLLSRVDFEENERFPLEIPQGFFRVLTKDTGVPGLPAFGRIATERGVGRGEGARWAVRFNVDGASMALSMAPGRVAVEPGAQIVVRAWARTEELAVAGARIAVRFHDADGKPVGGLHASAVVRSEAEWRELVVEPPAAPADARSAVLWLEVVQPAARKDAAEPRFEVAQTDVHGHATFDDIEVWQMPTASFAPVGDGMVRPEARARLDVRCKDPASAVAQATVRVRDTDGTGVFECSFEVPADRAIALELPALPTGWYEAEADFSVGTQRIARRTARFAVLPEDPFDPDEPPRFGASLARADAALAPSVALARCAFVVIPAWTAATDPRDAKHEIDALRPTVGALIDRGVEPMFRLAEVPAQLAQANRLDGADVFALFALEEARWRPALEPWLLGFGQQVDAWFVGQVPVDGSRSDLAARVEALARAMRTSIAGPAVGVPWSPAESLDAALERAIVGGRHTVEAVVDAAWREDGASAFEGLPTGPRGMARIVTLPRGSVDDRARAIDLALRAIDAWRAGFDDVAIDVPADADGPVPGPPLELAAWRQLSTRLCGRRFVAEIPLAEGVRALLADGPRGPALVCWNESAPASDARGAVDVAVGLGTQSVQATDLWGRSTRVSPAPEGHALRIGREPLFVEGVEREMCLIRRGFRVDPAFVESRRAPQEAALVLANPWAVPVSGTIAVRGPEELALTPRVQRFSVDAGGEARIPIGYSVPRALAAGVRWVEVEVDGSAREPFRVRLSAPLEIGYRKAGVVPSWRLARSIESGAVDLVLSLEITNLTEEPIDVEAFAVADGYTQNRKPVQNLAPGAKAVRVFHFADGARRLSGRDIRAGVLDADGDARLMKRITVPPLVPPTASVAGADAGG